MRSLTVRLCASVSFILLVTSALVLALASNAGAAAIPVALTNVAATGTEKLKISVKNGPSFKIEGDVTLDIDGGGGASLDGTVDIEGLIDSSGRRPVLNVDNFSDIENQLEAMIDAAEPGMAPSNVVIDLEKDKVKLSAREKTDLGIKMSVSFPFTVNAMYAGKFSLKVGAVERRPPLCTGRTYHGIEAFKVSVSGIGSVSFKDEEATMALSAEATPFDEMTDFTYTNLFSSPNTTFQGMIDYSERRPTLVLDASAVDDLEENLEELILDEVGAFSTVQIGAQKTSIKCGKNGDSLTFSVSAAFIADFGIGGMRKGKVSISSKMVVAPF